jgi:hypothetical protein
MSPGIQNDTITSPKHNKLHLKTQLLHLAELAPVSKPKPTPSNSTTSLMSLASIHRHHHQNQPPAPSSPLLLDESLPASTLSSSGPGA